MGVSLLHYLALSEPLPLPSADGLLPNTAVNGQAGVSVAFSQYGTVRIAAIGAPGDTGGGAVYLYRYDDATRSWLLVQRLGPVAAGVNFGFAVSFSRFGDILVVGDPGFNGGAGRVDAFLLNEAAAGSFQPVSFREGTGTEQFGFAVALGQHPDANSADPYGVDILAVGAPSAPAGGTQRGRVAVFYALPGTGILLSVPAVPANTGTNGDRFGFAVGWAHGPAEGVSAWTNRSRLLVGAPDKPNSAGNTGSVRVFRLDSAVDATGPWTVELNVVTAPALPGTGMGYAVTGFATVIHVGSTSETVWRYTRTGTTWALTTTMTPAASPPYTVSGFGRALSMTSNWLAIGAPFSSQAGIANHGLVFPYGTGITPLPPIVCPAQPQADAQFGFAVAAENFTIGQFVRVDTLVLIGEPFRDRTLPDRGNAYIVPRA